MTEQQQQEPQAAEEKKLSGPEYFEQRMKLYGISPEQNKIKIWRGVAYKNDNELQDFNVFNPCADGIEILVYTLDRSLVTYKGDQKMTDDGKEVEKRAWSKDYKLIRYVTPKVDAKGREHKYHIPKGAGSHPFFPPALVEKFEKKEKIKTLVATEGYFKAFKASMHGLDIVGLSSITHYKDKQKGTMHDDIIRIIRDCKVENFIWLADGDCNRISLKALAAGDDIYKRPNQFFNSCHQITSLLKDYDIFKYFSYVDSSSVDGEPKGLDDMLVALPGKEEEVISDLLALSKPAKYFYREDMTFSTAKIRKHFRLNSVNDFVEFHCEQMEEARKSGNENTDVPDLKRIDFVWNGTTYHWDDKESLCKIKVPGDAQRYFRVGDTYFEKVQIPNKHGALEHTFHRRLKQTIIDDYKKEFVDYIPKYKAFCNVPDHVNYQEVIHNCYNMYFPFDHEPAEGDCLSTLRFLRHIFGNKDVVCHHKEKGKLLVNELDLGLDYVQLLYQQPQQILPILCLVSREQGTGKTTFVNWLKLIFTQNVAIVGNADLANDFNASWAGKLLVVCEETKIDKTVVIERVKALSTGDKILMNAKGKDHVEIDFFAKFIFNTNNEENFIYASEDDVRYWVRKVPPVTDLFVDLLSELQDEIPAFLEYLNKRKMKTEKLHRAWFHPELIKTEALKKVIAFSQSTVEKEMREHFRNIFFEHGVSEVMMTVDAINETFFRNKYERKYLRNVLLEKIKVEPYAEFIYDGKDYKTLEDAKAAAGTAENEKNILRVEKNKRHTYPKWERMIKDGRSVRERVFVTDNGRPFVFKIKKFLLQEEIETRWIDPQALEEARIHNEPDKSWGQSQNDRESAQLSLTNDGKDDLPF
jgi:hypothetical protein